MADPKKPNESVSAPPNPEKSKGQPEPEPQKPPGQGEEIKEQPFEAGGGPSAEQKLKDENEAKQARSDEEIGDTPTSEGEDGETGESGAEEEVQEPVEEMDRRERQQKAQDILSGSPSQVQEGRPSWGAIQGARRSERGAKEEKANSVAQAEEKEKKTRSPKDKINDIIFTAIFLILAVFKDLLDLYFELSTSFQAIGFFASALTIAFLFPIMTARAFQKPKKLAGKAIFYTGLGIATLVELIPLINLLPLYVIIIFYTLKFEMKANDAQAKMEGADGGLKM